MIIKGSRYSETSEARDGKTTTISVSTSYSSDAYHSIVTYQDETFASLANTYMNNPSMYWKIADINKNLGYPDIIPAGTVVNIPLK